MSTSKTTPMIRHYLSVKEKHPDAVLFYRMGDFYEMFFEDAEIASRALEITLTSRNKKDETPVPMCGVPVRSVKGYIGKLIGKGYKVAVCDQVEDPSEAKGLVKREVVRVVTPGMIVENEFLDEKDNNFILAVYGKNNVYGLCYLDISTGTFRVAESPDLAAVRDEILRISPSEILVPESAATEPAMATIEKTVSGRPVTRVEDKHFNYKRSREFLLLQLKTLSLEGFGCEGLKTGIAAAGALLFYVKDTQKQELSHLSTIETYSLSDYLIVDDGSSRNLELLQNLQTGSRKGTLIDIIDKTATAMGARLFRQWLGRPLKDVALIRDRLDAVEEAGKDIHALRSIREKLKSVYDLERLTGKIAMGHCNARDLVALKNSVRILPDIVSDIQSFSGELFQLNTPLDELTGLGDLIDRSVREDAPPVLNEGGIIKPGYSPELDDLMEISRDGKSWLVQLEAEERKATGVNTLKVGYNKVFGYYLEAPKSQSEKIPPHYIRKQTLVNAERYITDELKSFESKVLGAEERQASLEYELFCDIRDKALEHKQKLQEVAAYIAQIDCLLNLAEIAELNGYCRPEINETGAIHIEDGRHPVVEKMITGERFVPNTLYMDNEKNQILIITGPNMAGKSTVLRQTALTVIMAQMGGFVPAKKASIGVTDRIFTRVGALDNLSAGQSTFMVEMQETANILNNATHDSLVIMDEIGRGTSTYDGLSIAWAVAEYLHDYKKKGIKTLFATHYHELTALAQYRPRVNNFNIAVREWNDEIIFLRKLVEGGTNRSYGIQVARLAGIPEKVIRRAKKILTGIEKDSPTTKIKPEPGDLSPPGHVQLSLFEKPYNAVLDKIGRLDLKEMTPIEALNFLNEIKQQVKNYN